MLLIFVALQFIFASEIQIRDITYTGSNVITLNDIANFKDVSSQQKKAIGSVVLAKDLNVGVERAFSKDSLINILKKYQPKNGRITFVIPEVATVKRVEDRFNKENVENKIAVDLAKTQSGVEVKVETVNFPDIEENIIDWELQVPNQLQSSHLVIPMKYTVRSHGKDIEKSESISIKVKLYQTIPVVKENTFQGQRLQAENLHLQKIEMVRGQLYVSNIQDIVGKKLKRNLRQGDAIKSTDLEKEYTIRAGESVVLLVQENDIKIRLEGTAKQNGSTGDVIRVNNPMNNRLVFGTINSASEVEVK
ncbi:MAG: flagellar basal body P-ring formation protein FlgA [Bdellovibrionales bacterium]|nr:flagellar basal body P-ring formation protein FlgA [Bdellovibrionales bacterium]